MAFISSSSDIILSLSEWLSSAFAWAKSTAVAVQSPEVTPFFLRASSLFLSLFVKPFLPLYISVFSILYTQPFPWSVCASSTVKALSLKVRLYFSAAFSSSAPYLTYVRSSQSRSLKSFKAFSALSSSEISESLPFMPSSFSRCRTESSSLIS